MKVSLNSVRALHKRYGNTDDIAPEGAEALAERIGTQLGAIEETIDIGAKYKGIVIAKVVSCEQHPNADRLHVCFIDDGGKVADVGRNENGHVQVVCGAHNVREGLTVAWLPPGSTVPDSVGKEPFVLEARELRGVVSNGMLASPKEMALGDNHDGILEIDDDVPPGTDFAEHFGLAGDVVFDIENKMFTHRPDCFGLLGVVRELAGIQQMPFKSPEWYQGDAPIAPVEADVLPLTLHNELPELVPRFAAITMRDVKVGPSPVWLQVELTKVGLRPINNIVDLTNWLMLESGQPIHAYDYDKVKARSGGDVARLTVRFPRPGEKIKLLNGKEIEPGPETMMVAAGDQLACVGGAMGGIETEVDDSTTHIIIEAANWDMYTIRRTSMALGIFTDAVTRFNKGQSPLQNRAVVARIVDHIRQLADGKVACELVDDIHVPTEVRERNSVHPPVTLSAGFINDRLGLKLDVSEIKTLLTNIEFDVQTDGEQLTVKAPFWRTDIEIPEDVVEEAGRLYGFDRLPLELPRRSISPAKKNEMLELKQRVRDVLSRAGANEVLNYTFVHGKLLERAGQNPDDAFKLSNALSPDLQYYRLSLTPSLLDKVHPNIKAGYDEFAIFEIGKGHNLRHADDDDGLPSEFEMLDLIYTTSDKVKRPGAALYDAKRYLDALADGFGLELAYAPVEPAMDYPVTKPYDLKRSALVTVKGSGDFLGMVGEFRPEVARGFKLPARTAAFGIGLKELLAATRKAANPYVPLSRFPKVEQDICLKVPAGMPYAQLYDFVAVELAKVRPENSHSRLSPVDIYQRDDDAAHKQITLRLTIAHHEKTLRDTEVAAMLDAIAAAARASFDAERI